jgi:hypothetical protein
LAILFYYPLAFSPSGGIKDCSAVLFIDLCSDASAFTSVSGISTRCMYATFEYETSAACGVRIFYAGPVEQCWLSRSQKSMCLQMVRDSKWQQIGRMVA